MTKQDYRTPPEFLTAVESRFGRIGFDLAATDGHEVGLTGMNFNEQENALTKNWVDAWEGPDNPVVWLNPPYANIRPWVAKLDAECRELSRWTLCLIPYSGGSGWWRDHVLGKCMVFGIPRIKFMGADAVYNKDLALLAYGFGVNGVGYWDWRKK